MSGQFNILRLSEQPERRRRRPTNPPREACPEVKSATDGPASSVAIGRSMESARSWNEAAQAGALGEYKGDAPEISPTTVSWLYGSMHNDQEAYRTRGVLKQISIAIAVGLVVFAWCVVAGVLG